MPNYFTDNKDLLFQFSRLDLRAAVAILEHDYTEAATYPDAPENYEDAMTLYEGALELSGDLAGNFIAPRAMKVDAEGAKHENGKVSLAKGTEEALQKLAEAGLMGVIIPRKYGGINFPATIFMMMIELISRADASLMTLFGYQDVGEAIAKFGTEAVATAFLPKYARGEHSGAMVLTEPSAGSDLQSVKLKAFQDKAGQWRLRGVKHFISNGSGDVLLVLARSEPNTSNMFGLSLFACRGGEKVQVTRIEEKMGLHASPTCELYFDDAPAYLVGKRRFGLMHVLYILNHARFSVAAQALGIAEAAYHEALAFAKQRVQFGQVIYDMPPIANMLIEMRVAIESSRTLLYNACQLLDLRNKLEEKIEHLKTAGESAEDEKKRFQHTAKLVDMLSPMVKYVITEAACKVCNDALQIHGGMGYMREMAVERLYRDVRITTIYEGTTQVQVIGASKGIFADILADFFDVQEAQDFPKNLQKMALQLKKLRQVFKTSVELLQSHKEKGFKEAGAKAVADMYAGLYTGYLLLAEARENQRKIAIAHRYIASALAKAWEGRAAIENGQYGDLDKRDQICNI